MQSTVSQRPAARRRATQQRQPQRGQLARRDATTIKRVWTEVEPIFAEGMGHRAAAWAGGALAHDDGDTSASEQRRHHQSGETASDDDHRCFRSFERPFDFPELRFHGRASCSSHARQGQKVTAACPERAD
jgi:hypothetical protein